ncbi:uncharacterized protein [Epargyreus clarus]|uniref:uncharacterized protein n=1 Tax=Epargyreus clarus TaxID=520877 RepID=UPI003C2CEC0A
MDSNSNSCELTWAKEEIETDDRSDEGYNSKLNKPHWNSENTMKLIFVLENDCKELWDIKHPMHKDKNARQGRHEYLAEMFGTTAEEIVRKLHNLRTQLNNELRKIKRRQSEYNDGSTPTSGWEYFDALSFLVRQHTMDISDPLNVDGVNLALAEFQADEELVFGPRVKAAKAAASPPKPKPVKALRVAASAPPPLPPSAHPMMWPEQPLPRLQPGLAADECQIFGDFVASELRTLRSEGSRRRLKRIIQKAILDIGEEEDGSLLCG